jgi:hypothetical protein
MTSADVPGTASIARTRAGLLAVVLLVTSVIAVVGGLFWPEAGSGDWYSYGDIAPLRDRWWALLTVMSASLVLNVPAQALAAVALTRGRGAGCTTVGAALMWLGTGLYAVGVAGWAATYYFATDPAFDRDGGAALLELVEDDPRLFAAAIPGAVLVALGTVVQAVGLLRSHALPTWVPILSLTIVLTFLLPGEGWLGLVFGLPVAVAGTALGWFTWRSTAQPESVAGT